VRGGGVDVDVAVGQDGSHGGQVLLVSSCRGRCTVLWGYFPVVEVVSRLYRGFVVAMYLAWPSFRHARADSRRWW
jgi:hypothetical protein